MTVFKKILKFLFFWNFYAGWGVTKNKSTFLAQKMRRLPAFESLQEFRGVALTNLLISTQDLPDKEKRRVLAELMWLAIETRQNVPLLDRDLVRKLVIQLQSKGS